VYRASCCGAVITVGFTDRKWVRITEAKILGVHHSILEPWDLGLIRKAPEQQGRFYLGGQLVY